MVGASSSPLDLYTKIRHIHGDWCILPMMKYDNKWDTCTRSPIRSDLCHPLASDWIVIFSIQVLAQNSYSLYKNQPGGSSERFLSWISQDLHNRSRIFTIFHSFSWSWQTNPGHKMKQSYFNSISTCIRQGCHLLKLRIQQDTKSDISRCVKSSGGADIVGDRGLLGPTRWQTLSLSGMLWWKKWHLATKLIGRNQSKHGVQAIEPNAILYWHKKRMWWEPRALPFIYIYKVSVHPKCGSIILNDEVRQRAGPSIRSLTCIGSAQSSGSCWIVTFSMLPPLGMCHYCI